MFKWPDRPWALALLIISVLGIIIVFLTPEGSFWEWIDAAIWISIIIAAYLYIATYDYWS